MESVRPRIPRRCIPTEADSACINRRLVCRVAQEQELASKAEQFSRDLIAEEAESQSQDGDSSAAELQGQYEALRAAVADLQAKIDALYKATFKGVETAVIAQASTSKTAAREATAAEQFDDLTEATFNLLGRQRPQVMQVCLFSKQLTQDWAYNA